jgi:hypothetical protein
MLEVATNPDKDKSWMKRIRENQWKQIYPAVSSPDLSSSSVTEFTNHISAAHPRSIMTNYDYTQYDASSSMMKEELRAALASSELIDDCNSILDNSGCGIHKSSWPVDEEEEDDAKVKANTILAPNTPRTSGDTESKRAASSPNNTLDIDTTLTKSSTKASQKSKKSSGSKILRLFLRGKKSKRSASKKGGVIATCSTPDTPDTDASSRKLDDCSPLPHNDTLASDVTPTATDSSFIQRRSSFAEPPIIPLISSPHIPPRNERVQQQERVNDLLRKISAREDEMSKGASSQDTARMTDDDTSDGGEVNSTAATREPKEGYNSEDCPVDDDNDAAKHIFVENVVNYNSFFSGSGCTDVATEIDSKDEDADGIKSKQPRTLSTEYNDSSVCDDESNMDGAASFDDTLDSINHTCDPCGVVGELMADVSEAIHDLIDLLKLKQQPIARRKKKNEALARSKSIDSRCSNTRKSRSSSRRQSTVYRIDDDVNIQQRRRLT